MSMFVIASVSHPPFTPDPFSRPTNEIGNTKEWRLVVVKQTNRLVERVRPGAPPREEHRQADRLDDLGRGRDANNVERPLLGEDLGDEL